MDPTSHTNNASTAPGHAKNLISELNENDYSDSIVTEHTDEKRQQITGLWNKNDCIDNIMRNNLIFFLNYQLSSENVYILKNILEE